MTTEKPQYWAELPLPCLDSLTKSIKEEDLNKQPGKDPIERKHHITLHVFLPSPPDEALTKKIQGTKPFWVSLKGIGCFENKTQDVLYVKVEVTQPLLDLHKLLVDEYKIPWPQESYTPHATLAFLKPGTAKKYTETIECDETALMMRAEFHQFAVPGKVKDAAIVVQFSDRSLSGADGVLIHRS